MAIMQRSFHFAPNKKSDQLHELLRSRLSELELVELLLWRCTAPMDPLFNWLGLSGLPTGCHSPGSLQQIFFYDKCFPRCFQASLMTCHGNISVFLLAYIVLIDVSKNVCLFETNCDKANLTLRMIEYGNWWNLFFYVLWLPGKYRSTGDMGMSATQMPKTSVSHSFQKREFV